MDEDTRPLRRVRPSRPRRLGRALLRGCALLPGIVSVALFLGLLTAQAMYREEMAELGEIARGLLDANGWLAIPESPAAPSPDATLIAAQLRATLQADIAAIPTVTSTFTPTATHSPTASPTVSPTPTHTETSSPTPTASITASPTPTATLTPTLTPSRTPTRTHTPTYPPPPTWTRTPRPTNTPVPTPVPPTATPPDYTPPPPSPTPSPAPIGCDAVINTGFESQVVQMVNQERQSRGLYAYAVQSQLRAAARVHAADMACNHFTGHTGSDGSSVRDRVEAQGYAWSWIGENYMVTHDTVNGPQVAFNWWMNSAPHTANILSPNYTEFGVGYVYSDQSDYGGYFVIVFARPR